MFKTLDPQWPIIAELDVEKIFDKALAKWKKGETVGPMKKYNGIVKLFGLFHIKKDTPLELECTGNPNLWTSSEIKTLEPILQKTCTITWAAA